MLKRDITIQIIEWEKNKERKPLIIEGARQVGKTFIIEDFIYNHSKNKYIKINFILQKKAKLIFEGDLSSDVIKKNLLNFFGLNAFEGEIIYLFLDEIQECPEAITALKFLQVNSGFSIICSGSLLGISYNKVKSFPVGYVERLTLNPLSFKEFCYALNKGDLLKEALLAYSDNIPINPLIHETLSYTLREYIVVGGMPEVINKYCENSVLYDINLIQNRIINDYRNDIAKYSQSTTKIKAREIFDSIPSQLAKDNKKFQYKHVSKNARSSSHESSISWLIEAGLVLPAYLLTNIQKPLNAYMSNEHFKIYLNDIGLLSSMYEIDSQNEILNGELGIAKGAIYENLVAQMLYNLKYKLSYYQTLTLEIDFIINYHSFVTAIEVKSGTNTKSKSLSTLFNAKMINKGIRVSSKNFGKSQNLLIIPFYLLEEILRLNFS